jgi:uncharacterized protein (TIGR03790 family)
VQKALTRERLQDRVLYLVLTKGIPLEVAGTIGSAGTASSVDSELTLLYRRMSGQTVAVAGRIPNPYFLGTAAVASAKPFTHRDHDIYLVTRLDGFTVDDVIGLIDRGAAPRNEGQIVLISRQARGPDGRGLAQEAATRLTARGLGDRVVLESR